MSNLLIYDAVRKVPKEAQKEIKGGRLSGKTDINPMWRIKTLTEQFGPCGLGWKYEIVDKRLEQGANGEIAAFVDINLYVIADGKCSDAIPGTGGSMFVAKEKSGLYTSDECFKMALTDAISVSCKALGVAADIYWENDTSKYDVKPETKATSTLNKSSHTCEDCGKTITATKQKTVEQILEGSQKYYKKTLCQPCISKRYKAQQEAKK